MRRATVDDVDWIVSCVRAFIEETSWPVTFSEHYSRWFINSVIESPLSDVLVDKSGGAFVYCAHEFTDRPFCYVGKFFVLPEHRKGTAALRILRGIERWARDHDCSHIFATSTSGFDPTLAARTTAIFERLGYEPAGPTLVRRL